MEFDLFGVQGSVRIDHGLWLREHGVDGLSIVHATGAARGGAELSGVSVNVYTQDGQFIERVESSRATLQPGAWLLEEARVTSPGEPPTDVGQYLLATDLTPEQLAAAAAPPQGVPFWDLPEMTAQTAGRRARRARLPPAIPKVAREAAAARRHGPRRGGVFLKIFSIWRHSQDAGGWRRRRLRALYRDRNLLRPRRRGNDQPIARRLVARARRDHAWHAVAAAFGRWLTRRPPSARREPMSPRTPGLGPGGQGGPSVAPTMGRRSPQGIINAL